MKHCNRCDKNLDVSFFTPSASRYDGLQTYCRECMKLYRIEHYQANKKQYQDRNKATKNQIRAMIRKAKDRPCMDCGVAYPYYVMDFDHRDSTMKEYTISQMIPGGSISSVKREIEKCDVVCSNCHRERTHKSGSVG